jgi:hypothetical protein
VGVGNIARIAEVSESGLPRCAPHDSESSALGVGHVLTASRSVVPSCDVHSSFFAVALLEPLASLAVAVGHVCFSTAAFRPVYPPAYPSVRVFGPACPSLASGVGHATACERLLV